MGVGSPKDRGDASHTSRVPVPQVREPVWGFLQWAKIGLTGVLRGIILVVFIQR